MKIVINGSELDTDLHQDATLGTALKIIQDEKVSNDSVISSIWIDGEPLSAQLLSEWKDRPASEFGEARIDAPNKRLLASNSLRILSEGLAESVNDRNEVVKQLQQGQSEGAMKLLPPYLNLWGGIQESISSVSRLLDLDLTNIEIISIDQSSNNGSGQKTKMLVEHIDHLAEILMQMKESLESGDLVLLGDTLDYEFADLTDNWQKILLELADRLDQPN